MFTKRIIPGNKTWVYGYDVEMKNRKVCQVGSNMKLILMVFFYIEGIIHHEFLSGQQRISGIILKF